MPDSKNRLNVGETITKVKEHRLDNIPTWLVFTTVISFLSFTVCYFINLQGDFNELTKKVEKLEKSIAKKEHTLELLEAKKETLDFRDCIQLFEKLKIDQ